MRNPFFLLLPFICADLLWMWLLLKSDTCYYLTIKSRKWILVYRVRLACVFCFLILLNFLDYKTLFPWFGFVVGNKWCCRLSINYTICICYCFTVISLFRFVNSVLCVKHSVEYGCYFIWKWPMYFGVECRNFILYTMCIVYAFCRIEKRMKSF